MSNFGKVRRKDDSFLADGIRLDHIETIKVIGEEGIRNGLEFMVPGNEARISDQWRMGKSQTSHFHVVALQNGLRFPLSVFVLELLYDYDIAPSQLALNAWRIL